MEAFQDPLESIVPCIRNRRRKGGIVFRWFTQALFWVALLAPADAGTPRISFNAPRAFALPGDSPTAVVGDFTGNGRPDVATGACCGHLSMLLNRGGGDFERKPTQS